MIGMKKTRAESKRYIRTPAIGFAIGSLSRLTEVGFTRRNRKNSKVVLTLTAAGASQVVLL